MKNEIFKTELAFIKSDEIRNFTEKALENLPDYFWHVPASSSGKYHPPYALGDGGLVRHTIAAVNIAQTLMELEQYKNAMTDIWHDCVISALLLHDGFKQGKESKAGHTVKDHAIICADWVKSDELFKSFRSTKDKELIADLIRTHMGEWDTNNKPGTSLQKFVHMCDFLASRKTIIYDFGKRVTTVDGKGVITEANGDENSELENVDPKTVIMPFGKHKDKSIAEIAKDYMHYITWALENMTNLDPKIEAAMKMVARKSENI